MQIKTFLLFDETIPRHHSIIISDHFSVSCCPAFESPPETKELPNKGNF